MPFVKVPGLEGKVYVPQNNKGCPKKHPCKDCFACDHCSDDRCRVCRMTGPENCGNKRVKQDWPGYIRVRQKEEDSVP